MQFGVCAGPEATSQLKDAGFDYVEVGAQAIFQGRNDDEQFDGDAKLKPAVLPAPAANGLLPGDMKIVGLNVDFEAVKTYMTRVTARAGKLGAEILVFGAGAARNVPEGFDRHKAREQILDFLRMAGPLAQDNGITLVIEPLNRSECNILNSVDEAMAYVREVDHPGVQCLVDSYHFWTEDEPLAHLEAAMPHIRHVHVADRDGRVAPGVSGTSDYRAFFGVLKRGGYDGRCSIEGRIDWDEPAALSRHNRFLREAWEAA